MEILYIHQDILITMTSLESALYLICLCLWRIGKFDRLWMYLYTYKCTFIVDMISNHYDKLLS